MANEYTTASSATMNGVGFTLGSAVYCGVDLGVASKNGELVCGAKPKLTITVGCKTIDIDKNIRRKAQRVLRAVKSAVGTGSDVNYQNQRLTTQDVENFIRFLDENKIK